MGKENGGIDKIREKFIRFYTIILFQTKLEKKERERWNEIVGPSNRILCHRFDETDGRFRNKDFIAGQRIVSEISIVLFEHPHLRFVVSRVLWSWIASCFELLRFDGRGRGRGRGKGDEEERKRNAPFLYAQHPLPELVTIDIVSLISYPINSNEFSNLLIKFRANARADSP